MPVILPEQHHAAWLVETENENLKELLVRERAMLSGRAVYVLGPLHL
jgi:hypothetical protein